MYGSSKNLYNEAKKDQTGRALIACGFSINQTIVLYLKGLVELTGQQYIEDNNPLSQIELLNKYEELSETLDKIYVTYQKWNENIRKNTDYNVFERRIVEALEICEMLYQYCDKLIKVTSYYNSIIKLLQFIYN